MDSTFFESKNILRIEKRAEIKNKATVKRTIIRIIGTILIPALFIIISFMLGNLSYGGLFASSYELNPLINTSAVSYLALIAVSINLISGRMDFSLGSIGVLAPMLACMATNNMPGGNILFLPLCALFGIILGLLSSCAYIFLRLPAIVSGLGVCIFYEGMTQALRGNSGNLYYTEQFNGLRNNVTLSISLIIIAFIIFYLLIKFSKYWMNKNALNSNQFIAVDTGVKEIPNVMMSYALAGLFMSLSGALKTLNLGYMASVAHFASSTAVFDFFPLGIGIICGVFSTPALGIFLGAMTNEIFKVGIQKTGIVSVYRLMITPIIMFVFLIFVFTAPRVIVYIKTKMSLNKKRKIDLLTKLEK